jgi:hypothetical protein
VTGTPTTGRAIGVQTAEECDAAEGIALSFMQTQMRMAVEERRLIAHLFAEDCRTQMPDNVHLNMDIVRRDLASRPPSSSSAFVQ